MARKALVIITKRVAEKGRKLTRGNAKASVGKTPRSKAVDSQQSGHYTISSKNGLGLDSEFVYGC